MNRKEGVLGVGGESPGRRIPQSQVEPLPRDRVSVTGGLVDRCDGPSSCAHGRITIQPVIAARPSAYRMRLPSASTFSVSGVASSHHAVVECARISLPSTADMIPVFAYQDTGPSSSRAVTIGGGARPWANRGRRIPDLRPFIALPPPPAALRCDVRCPGLNARMMHALCSLCQLCPCFYARRDFYARLVHTLTTSGSSSRAAMAFSIASARSSSIPSGPTSTGSLGI